MKRMFSFIILIAMFSFFTELSIAQEIPVVDELSIIEESFIEKDGSVEDQLLVQGEPDKSCLEFSAEDCPEKFCRIMVGCSGKEMCYFPRQYDPPECGGLSYDGQEAECCEGFVKKCGIEFFDGSCDMEEGYKSYEGVPICLPCGNGICNQFENRCNCPEDCVE